MSETSHRKNVCYAYFKDIVIIKFKFRTVILILTT